MNKEYQCPVCKQVFPRKQDHYNKSRYPCDPIAVERCRRELEKLNKEANMKFALSETEVQKMNEWLKEHNLTCPHASGRRQGAIGGRLTYSFTPTSLGTFSSVLCACGARELFTDLDGI